MNGSLCIELLADIRDPGYPDEYLYSRIRGRRSRMTANWKAAAQELSFAQGAIGTARTAAEMPATIWRDLLREHRWVYGQMRQGLRAVFAPFFLYAEIRTVCIGLRGRPDQKAERIGDLLAASLLEDGIKRTLLGTKEQAGMLKALERRLVRLAPDFAGLAVLAEKGGLRAVEQRITNRYLAAVARADLHPLMHAFFGRIIDARNLIALYKTFKLEDPARPEHIPGGALSAEKFNDILKRGDLPDVLDLVRQLTGSRTDLKDASRIEIAFYRGMTRELRKECRDPLHAGLILHYLWRCSIEAMNRSMLVHTRDLDRETVLAELVQ